MCPKHSVSVSSVMSSDGVPRGAFCFFVLYHRSLSVWIWKLACFGRKIKEVPEEFVIVFSLSALFNHQWPTTAYFFPISHVGVIIAPPTQVFRRRELPSVGNRWRLLPMSRGSRGRLLLLLVAPNLIFVLSLQRSNTLIWSSSSCCEPAFAGKANRLLRHNEAQSRLKGKLTSGLHFCSLHRLVSVWASRYFREIKFYFYHHFAPQRL